MIKMILGLLIVLFIIYIFAKSGDKINPTMATKQIKIIDRTQISKESSILIVRISDKGYVICCSDKKTDIIREFTEDEITAIEKQQEEAREKMLNTYKGVAMSMKNNLKKITRKNVKDDKNEKFEK